MKILVFLCYDFKFKSFNVLLIFLTLLYEIDVNYRNSHLNINQTLF